HLREVDLVARTVQWLASLAEGERTARRRVVTTRGGPLDHEAVDVAARLARQHRCQRVAGNDGEEARTREPDRLDGSPMDHRVEVQLRGHSRLLVLDVELEGRGAMLGECVEHARNLLGNSGTHQ